MYWMGSICSVVGGLTCLVCSISVIAWRSVVQSPRTRSRLLAGCGAWLCLPVPLRLPLTGEFQELEGILFVGLFLLNICFFLAYFGFVCRQRDPDVLILLGSGGGLLGGSVSLIALGIRMFGA